MKTIPVKNTDRLALVDDEDYPMLSRFNWRLSSTTGYVVTVVNNNIIQMNRFIFGSQAKAYWLIVYKDGDLFNNQKGNLEFWRHSDYAKFTRRGRTATSKYLGVFFHRPMCKWCIKPVVNGKKLPTEYFDSELAAAKRYIAVMKKHGRHYTLDTLMSRKPNYDDLKPMLSLREPALAM
jgi:hypothetical protein